MRLAFHTLLLMLLLSGAGAVVHADTRDYPVRDRYGNYDPYYNGHSYVPVPASVLYGCNGSHCRNNTSSYYDYSYDTNSSYPDTRYSNQPYDYRDYRYDYENHRYYDDPVYYPDYSKTDYRYEDDRDTRTNRHSSSSNDPKVTINEASNNYSYTGYYFPAYPGTPNTGAGEEGSFNLFILIASMLTAAGGLLYILRAKRS